MSKRPVIYISGPYTGDTPEAIQFNVDAAIKAAALVIQYGGAPLVPHLSHYIALTLEGVSVSYETWMDIDFSLVEVSHAVWRISGNSSGGDREVLLALKKGIPVFTSKLALGYFISHGGTGELTLRDHIYQMSRSPELSRYLSKEDKSLIFSFTEKESGFSLETEGVTVGS